MELKIYPPLILASLSVTGIFWKHCVMFCYIRNNAIVSL